MSKPGSESSGSTALGSEQTGFTHSWNPTPAPVADGSDANADGHLDSKDPPSGSNSPIVLTPSSSGSFSTPLRLGRPQLSRPPTDEKQGTGTDSPARSLSGLSSLSHSTMGVATRSALTGSRTGTTSGLSVRSPAPPSDSAVPAPTATEGALPSEVSPSPSLMSLRISVDNRPPEQFVWPASATIGSVLAELKQQFNLTDNPSRRYGLFAPLVRESFVGEAAGHLPPSASDQLPDQSTRLAQAGSSLGSASSWTDGSARSPVVSMSSGSPPAALSQSRSSLSSLVSPDPVRAGGSGRRLGLWLNEAVHLSALPWLASSSTQRPLECRSQMRVLRVRDLDGALRKTVLVAEGESLPSVLQIVAHRFGLQSAKELGLQLPTAAETAYRHGINWLDDQPCPGLSRHGSASGAVSPPDSSPQSHASPARTDTAEFNFMSPSLGGATPSLPFVPWHCQVGADDTLILRKRWFVQDHFLTAQSPVEVHFAYLEARQLVVSGALDSWLQLEAAVELAGLQMQIAYRDYDPLVHVAGFLASRRVPSSPVGALSELLPERFWRTEYIEEDIFKAHRRLKGLSESDAKFRYLQRCLSCALYGVTVLPVRERPARSEKFEREILLGVSRDAILRLQPGSREVLSKHSFFSLRDCVCSALGMAVGGSGGLLSVHVSRHGSVSVGAPRSGSRSTLGAIVDADGATGLGTNLSASIAISNKRASKASAPPPAASESDPSLDPVSDRLSELSWRPDSDKPRRFRVLCPDPVSARHMFELIAGYIALSGTGGEDASPAFAKNLSQDRPKPSLASQ